MRQYFRPGLEFALITVCVVTVFPIAYDFAFQRWTDYNYWFEYQSVEPTKSEYQIGEPLIMRSTREIFRPVTLEFSDKLVCELDGRRVIYAIAGTSHTFLPHDELSADWHFEDHTPDFATLCYMVSAISAVLPHAKQTQIIESGTFHFVEPVRSED